MPIPTMWFDASTVRQLRHCGPVGLSRVEAHVLAGALTLPAERVGFGFFDRYTSAMQAMPRPAVMELLDGFGRAGGNGHGAARSRAERPMLTGLREIERRARLTGRRLTGRMRRIASRDATIPFRSGDLFIVSGATWGQWEPVVLESLLEQRGVRLVIVLADMIPWRYPHHFEDQPTVARFEAFADLAARRASAVLCISEATRSDFLAFAGMRPRGSVEVIHLGSDSLPAHGCRPDSLPSDWAERGFVLTVGTVQVRKNHQLLYHVWRRFAEEGRRVPRLVMAGSPGWLTGDLMRQLRSDPLIQDSITVIDRVNDTELTWLYRHARFTLYPALYEGWGLPIVESFQHGTPCLAANTSSMPEAGQGLATHLDPLDFAAWHREILRRFTEPSIVAAEAERVRAAFRPRSWDDFSREFIGRVLSLADGSASSLERSA